MLSKNKNQILAKKNEQELNTSIVEEKIFKKMVMF